MPKSHQSTPRPKSQDTLEALRYDSANAAKSMNNYEKMLLRQQQAVKSVGVKASCKKRDVEAGALSHLFATIH